MLHARFEIYIYGELASSATVLRFLILGSTYEGHACKYSAIQTRSDMILGARGRRRFSRHQWALGSPT